MRRSMSLAAVAAIALISGCNSGGTNNQVRTSGNEAGGNVATPATPAANSAVAGNATGPAPAAGAQTQGGDWAGIYKATVDGGTGELTITSERAGTYRASLGIGREGCAGSVEGTGTSQGNRLIITAPVQDGRQCEITLTRDGDMIRIAEKNCSYFHGASCGFDGTARR